MVLAVLVTQSSHLEDQSLDCLGRGTSASVKGHRRFVQNRSQSHGQTVSSSGQSVGTAVIGTSSTSDKPKMPMKPLRTSVENLPQDVAMIQPTNLSTEDTKCPWIRPPKEQETC
jgi:hypothetical protein